MTSFQKRNSVLIEAQTIPFREKMCVFGVGGWEGSIESSVTQLGAIWKFVGTFLLIVIPGDAGSQWWKARSAKLL